MPPLLLAKVNAWSVEDIYRLKKSSIRNMVISLLSGFSLWFFAFYVSKITRILLDNKIGVLANRYGRKGTFFMLPTGDILALYNI